MSFEEFRKKSLDIRQQIADYRIINDDHERDIAINNHEIHRLEYKLVELQHSYEQQTPMSFEEFRKKSLDIRQQIADYRIINDDHERDIAINNHEIHRLEYELVELQHSYEQQTF